MNDAATMLAATLKWRESFKIDELLKEEFPADVFGQLGHIYGVDKDNHPVVLVLRSALEPRS